MFFAGAKISIKRPGMIVGVMKTNSPSNNLPNMEGWSYNARLTGIGANSLYNILKTMFLKTSNNKENILLMFASINLLEKPNEPNHGSPSTYSGMFYGTFSMERSIELRLKISKVYYSSLWPPIMTVAT